MKQGRKSNLFLMELMIALLIFAVCASVCAAIIAKASVSITESRDMSNALILAQNHAELIKSGNETEGNTFKYNADLISADSGSEEAAYYVVSEISASDNGLTEYKIEVFREADSKLIYTIDSAFCS
ncbi:MAG: hypothetical protein HDT44_05965 [Ruminococcaceae bacterium]|nr:hypothetical protein [Oscillospiraceae bacterium]